MTALRSPAFQGTPGTEVTLRAAVGVLVVLDRKADTWERTGQFQKGEVRFAVQHEPSQQYTLADTRATARAEAERIAGLSRAALFAEMNAWKGA